MNRIFEYFEVDPSNPNRGYNRITVAFAALAVGFIALASRVDVPPETPSTPNVETYDAHIGDE